MTLIHIVNMYLHIYVNNYPQKHTSTTHRISFSSIRPSRSISYIEKKSSVFRTGSFVDVILTAIRNSTKSNQIIKIILYYYLKENINTYLYNQNYLYQIHEKHVRKILQLDLFYKIVYKYQ